MAFLTDQDPATGVTLNDLIHIVVTGDTSQSNPAGSSYKATLSQLVPLFSGSSTSFTGGSGNCIVDLYVTNIHGCSPITIHDSVQSVGSVVSGNFAYALGYQVSADTLSTASGYQTYASGVGANSKGTSTFADGNGSHAEGFQSTSYGSFSHAEGAQTTSIGSGSHSEGFLNISIGNGSHSEGYQTTSSGYYSHSEGVLTTSSGYYTHAEGGGTIALGVGSHSEGYETTTFASYSHSEGLETSALGDQSHAEGHMTTTIGPRSHSEGFGTITNGDYQHVQGMWNITASTQGAFIVGNGSDNSNRSNLIFAAGNEVIISGSTGINVSSPTSKLDINSTNGYDQFRLRQSYTPSSSGDTNGNIGNIVWDNNYLYVKTNTGWGRILLDYGF